MKKHLANIWFDLPDGRAFSFCGYVTTRTISPGKLFFKVFGFELPGQTQITLA
jgi:hypothetical protein